MNDNLNNENTNDTLSNEENVNDVQNSMDDFTDTSGTDVDAIEDTVNSDIDVNTDHNVEENLNDSIRVETENTVVSEQTSTYVQTGNDIIDNTIYTVETPVNSVNQNSEDIQTVGNKKNNVAGTCFLIILIAGVIIGGLTFGTKYLVNSKNTDEINITARPADITADEKGSSKKKENSKNDTTQTKTNDGLSVADIVDNVMPSIVSIACKVSQEYNFFGRSYSEDAEGSGSGIIIGQNEKQVYIATNNHVIDGANTVLITFNDGEEVEAEIKGTDSSNDLAVVSVDISDLKKSTKEAIKVASLGKSENCKVGEMAIAIGNALGYGQSVTVGVISALNREISSEDYTMSLIQTDAAINPGNSGGALLNAKGEVIGINSVKYVSEDTEGMGYAIPITEAIDILNNLMNYEEIPEAERAYLGIVGYDIDEVFSQRSNIPEGIYIQEVSQKSPAAKSGLVVGDVIVKFDGKKVSTMEGIQNIMKNKKAKDKVEVVVMRASNGVYKEKTITVEFGARGDFVK